MLHQRSFNHFSNVLIINADDLGCSPSIDQGIVELLLSGRISSFSAIVNDSNSLHAAESILKLRQTSPQIFQRISMGLHLNFTRGEPLSKAITTSSVVQNGKFTKQFSKLANNQGVSEQQIAEQFRQQVKRFIQLFKRRPSHLDGHNHVHIFPCVARAIAKIMSEFGIYKTRLPAEKDLEIFGSFLRDHIKDVREIYRSHSIIWPDVFLGTEDSGNLKAQRIMDYISSSNSKFDFNAIQLMCHPGYPNKQGAGWTSKQDRLREKQQLQSQEFAQLKSRVGGLASYFDLQEKSSAIYTPKLLIYSKLEKATGNYTTALRLKAIFEKMGYKVYTWSIEPQIQTEIEAEDLERFLISFGISLIIGINASRSAKTIHEATHSSTKIRIQVPYILVIAGTDANYTFQNPSKCEQMKQYLRWSQCIISISKDMTKITQNILKQLNIQKNIYTIVQSSCLGHQDIWGKGQVTQMKDQNKNTSDEKYILFPTSFRRIKCVEHVFKQLNELILKHNLKVFVVGPIIEGDYYQSIKSGLRQIEYLGTLDQQQYAQKLKKAYAVINCSQTEGMSCSILQALQFGVPVIARSNAGNSQLISDSFNGFIYQTPQDFSVKLQKLLKDSTLRNFFIQNGKKTFNQSYSLEAEIKKYQSLVEKQINRKTMELSLNQKNIRIFNEPHVHSTSQVNNQLFLQMEPQLKNDTILDLGCGTAVFSLFYLLKAKASRVKLYLVDISDKILGNAIFNCRQSSLWSSLEIIAICQSDFFNKADKNIQFDIIVFNPPQTPFRHPENRLDKNGGTDGIKFYELLLKYFAESINTKLYLLHSYLAWPAKFKELLYYYGLKCSWKSEKGIHRISKDDYDKMESNLTNFILKHWREGKADIALLDNVFEIPAQIRLITK